MKLFNKYLFIILFFQFNHVFSHEELGLAVEEQQNYLPHNKSTTDIMIGGAFIAIGLMPTMFVLFSALKSEDLSSSNLYIKTFLQTIPWLASYCGLGYHGFIKKHLPIRTLVRFLSFK